ncbi:MAG: LptA/OstA family protein [Steroidobacteraceae bacterium]
MSWFIDRSRTRTHADAAPERRRLACLCLLAAVAWTAATTLALADEVAGPADAAGSSVPGTRLADLPCHEAPLCYVASHAESDPNHLVLYDLDLVDMTRGISRLKADRAEGSGRDFGSSGWVLTGHVQVFIPQGQMQADRATVQFASKRIDSVTAEGAPAEFEHVLENGQIAHGHAQAIYFNMVRNELQFDGNSWFSDGCNDITSGHIWYDITSQRVRAESDPGDSGRVHGTIRSATPNQCAPAAARP